jgi:hypothetical protein
LQATTQLTENWNWLLQITVDQMSYNTVQAVYEDNL